jgi:hypothetical protein
MSYRVLSYSGTDGVPGEVFTSPDWMLSEPVSFHRLSDGSVRVSDMDGFRGTDLRFAEDGYLTFNGERIDVGDDFPEYLGLLDEIADSPTALGVSYPDEVE